MPGNEDARVRLAASNLVGVMDNKSSQHKDKDSKAAALRIGKFVNGRDIKEWQDWGGVKKGISVPEMMLDKCIKLLQDAPLTLNIEPYKFFGAPVAGTKIQSIWHRLRSKGPGYGDFRENAEKIMFDYDTGDMSVNGVDVGGDIRKYGSTAGLGPNGQPRSNTFVADMRPKYAAVNFTWAKFGAACTYGMSHFVFKNYLRFNATYAPRDSFGVESQLQCGTYFNLAPILVHCAEYVLKQILDTARTRVPPGGPPDPPNAPIFYHEINKGGDNAKGSEYIEALLHCDIVFSRDVEKIRIARQEIADKSTADPVTLKRFTVTKKTMEKNIKAFAKQHNLGTAIEYF
ncbi:MAG: hypothetical protein K1X57_06680 [Gemmataceae bacterium]|nr:hypothetical protein [Gemmataceae bacterium]